MCVSVYVCACGVCLCGEGAHVCVCVCERGVHVSGKRVCVYMHMCAPGSVCVWLVSV